MGMINFKGFIPAPGLNGRINAMIGRKQDVIDSEVLRRCAPLIPLQTGELIRSGKAKGGEVEYTSDHAREQYYNTADIRPYDADRGGHWFERMKASQANEILEKAQDT